MIANLKRTQKRAGANAIARFSGRLAAGLAVAALFAAPARADDPGAPLGLRNGETLTYSVRWGFIPSVGRIRVTAEAMGTGDSATFKVTTTTWTWGLARGLFPFDGYGQSIYDAKTGLLLSSTASSTYRNKEVKNSIAFNYGKMTATFKDDVHPERSRVLPMPQGEPADLILALIQTRYWNLAPGKQRDALVIFQDQFYPLTIRAENEPEYVLTSLGLFKSVVLIPRMEKTPPIGMFKKGSTIRVWIATEDPRHLPVRFEVGFRFGTGTATLLDYQPPK